MFEITSRKAEPVEAKADFGLEDLFGLIEDFGRSVLRDIHLELERSALVKVTLQQMIENKGDPLQKVSAGIGLFGNVVTRKRSRM